MLTLSEMVAPNVSSAKTKRKIQGMGERSHDRISKVKNVVNMMLP
jgi:hypothetical protein